MRAIWACIDDDFLFDCGCRAAIVHAHVAKGQHVLITGIGGGVALIALQLCVAKGANVFVTSGSEDKLQKAAAIGAVGGVNYKSGEVVLTLPLLRLVEPECRRRELATSTRRVARKARWVRVTRRRHRFRWRRHHGPSQQNSKARWQGRCLRHVCGYWHAYAFLVLIHSFPCPSPPLGPLTLSSSSPCVKC